MAAEEPVGGDPRLTIYRRLVRGNLETVLEQMMPLTKALVGDAWETTFARFLEDVGPHTHYLRDVPHELLAFAAPLWKKDARVPAHAADLGAWELAHFAVSAAPKREHAPPGDLALDRAVLFDDAIRLLELDWSVHEDPIVERRVHLLLFRDRDHAIRALELSPLAYALVSRLLGGETLGDATKAAALEIGAALDGDVLGSIAQLLADFGERGVLLGSKDAAPDLR